MRILVNASNLTVGGGIQVTDSICRELFRFTVHRFVVVLPSVLQQCGNDIESYLNVRFVCYDQHSVLLSAIQGRDAVLDAIVEEERIDAVLSIFGFTKWRPKCLHICGFARPHWLLKDSPYWESFSLMARMKISVMRKMKMYLFLKSADVFYTENEYISAMLRKEFNGKKVYTVTNNYNQVFDYSELWDKTPVLPGFDGVTILTVSANYPHKNLPIIVAAIHCMKRRWPFLKFRFVLTIQEEEFVPLTDEEKRHILFLGRVRIEQCPALYEQSNICLLPSLLECFSATYAEAMRMNVPIITTDLGFAHSLCGDAAAYYAPLSPEALAEAIYGVCSSADLRKRLVSNGANQLKKFDTYAERARKLIGIIEKEYHDRNGYSESV